MENELFYDIFLNEDRIATVGPNTLNYLGISFNFFDGTPLVSASGISDEEQGRLFIDWLQKEVSFNDSIRISQSLESKASQPLSTKKLKQNMKSTKDDSFCDFCKRTEDEVGSLIKVGDTPQICNECVNLCVEIFKDKK